MEIKHSQKLNSFFMKFEVPSKYLHQEDFFSYSLSKNVAVVAVADGITRDPLNVSVLPNLKTKEGLIKFLESYPKPSPARKAAEIFCNTFVEFFKSPKATLDIKKYFEKSNEKISELNKGIDVDYLKNDFYACVGCGGIIENNILYYGFIADSGVSVFDKVGKLKFRTRNEGPRIDLVKDDVELSKSFGFPEFRNRVRSHYRNNPAEPLSYGAFTGEEKAMYFTRLGRLNLSEGDFVLFYTDGFEKIIFSREFDISHSFSELDSYFESQKDKIDGGEGTVVVVRV